MERLAKPGADVNALDADLYDAVTIAAVADDVPTLKAALAAGNKAGQHHQHLCRHRPDRGGASWA